MTRRRRTILITLGITLGAAALAGGAAGAMGWWGGTAGGPGSPYGMMGPGMMGYGGMDHGMMGGWWSQPPVPGATPLSAEQVNGFYVVVEGTDGKGAFELLVDRYGTWVHPEPGPNMMWNT